MSSDTLDLSASHLPQVALAFMNSVHSEELALVSELLTQLDDDTNNADISMQLNAWVAHTQAHFERENFLMQEYHFFAYPMHAAEHVQALQQLNSVQAFWDEAADREVLRGYIQSWRQWLQQHISTMDFVTAQFLSQFPLPNEAIRIDELRGHDTH
ncbi:hemerythrin family protein [uncultured Thiothrix sp.]|jgi:hemerythrin|uniref:bacteriohemerythrin n=1 Tax=uncultured Thiothrix sp. TaxID=223185 RepID=UPI0026118EC1|nr:hemerythrin family protein [uncultured Thiothrix sp.]HMT91481.1 hemerythrin family protein [Thiolinea sp.]